MKFVRQLMDSIAKNVLRCVFTVIFVVALIAKAMYSFDDSPYFKYTDIYDCLSWLLVAGAGIAIYRKREWLQNHMNYKMCFVLFMIAAVAYVCLVPLTPFSDMGGIYRGAIRFSKFQWQQMLEDPYWNMFPGNLRLSVFWGALLIPLPKTLLTLKLLNILMIYGTIHFTGKLAEIYRVKYYNLVYMAGLLFLPVFLYSNHVYFDMPFILLCTLALYLNKKKDNIILTLLVLGCASFLRKTALVFLAAVCIVYVFEQWENIKNKYGVKVIGRLLLGIALFMVLYKIPGELINRTFIEGNFKTYPGWNQIYIGLNEEEFGFMDGDFSYDRTGQDVLDRMEEYGPVRLTKILAKKTFWLWSQGTYQAQRYAFGSDTLNGPDKFEYETFLTEHLLHDGQMLRKFLNSFMRIEYLLLFALMIVSLWKTKRKEDFRIFYYLFMATFLILLLWELKSRYILQLMPLMLLMAGDGVEIVEKRIQLQLGR